MPIVEFEPAPILAEHVAAYWGLAAPPGMRGDSLQSLPSDGGITLIAQRAPSGETATILVGPRAEGARLPIRPGSQWWAIRFWPDAGGAVLGEDPESLAGHVVSPVTRPAWVPRMLESLAQGRDAESVKRIANEQLAAPVAAAKALDPEIRMAVQALIASQGQIAIADVAAGVGLSLRQLERRFLSAVGLNPIDYARIRRTRDGLATLLGTSGSWDEIAGKLGAARP
jgi:AraC-like DNA-binding protein